jgi:hypothetical protein
MEPNGYEEAIREVKKIPNMVYFRFHIYRTSSEGGGRAVPPRAPVHSRQGLCKSDDYAEQHSHCRS